MKKIFFCLFLLFFSQKIFAQRGASFNLQASALPLLGDIQLNYEYSWKRFCVGIGLNYFTSEYSADSLSNPYLYTNYYYQSTRFQHFMVPVSAGFHFPMGRRFVFTPFINAGFAYILSAKYMSWTDRYDNLYERRLTSQELGNYFRKFSVWAGLNLRGSYKVSDKISLLAAVYGRISVTPLNKAGMMKSQHGSGGGISLGVEYLFRGE